MSIDPREAARRSAEQLKAALNTLAAYEIDYGGRLSDDRRIGRIDESRGSPSFNICVGHIRMWATSISALLAVPSPAPNAGLREMSARMAEDDGLWFVAETAAEAYLQQELRKLCAAIEGQSINFKAPVPSPSPSFTEAYELGREQGRKETWREAVEVTLEAAAKAAEDTTRGVARSDFGLIGPAGIGMNIAAAIRALTSSPPGDGK